MPSLSSIRHPVERIHNPVGRLIAEHPGVVKIGRAGWFAKGVVYVIGGFLALSVAANKKVTDISASIMTHTAGRLVIGVVGVIVIVVGLYRISKGVTMDVEDELDMSGVSAVRRTWTERIGAIGEVGRGVGFGLVGFFLLRSAITYDVNDLSMSGLAHGGANIGEGSEPRLAVLRPFEHSDVETGPGHDVERVSVAHCSINTAAVAAGDHANDFVDVGRQFETRREQVRRAAGYDCQASRGVDHCLRRCTHASITTTHDDGLGAVLQRLGSRCLGRRPLLDLDPANVIESRRSE